MLIPAVYPNRIRLGACASTGRVAQSFPASARLATATAAARLCAERIQNGDAVVSCGEAVAVVETVCWGTPVNPAFTGFGLLQTVDHRCMKPAQAEVPWSIFHGLPQSPEGLHLIITQIQDRCNCQIMSYCCWPEPRKSAAMEKRFQTLQTFSPASGSLCTVIAVLPPDENDLLLNTSVPCSHASLLPPSLWAGGNSSNQASPPSADVVVTDVSDTCLQHSQSGECIHVPAFAREQTLCRATRLSRQTLSVSKTC